MLNLIKKALPITIKERLKPRYLSIYYANFYIRKAVITYYQSFFETYPPEYQVDKVPLFEYFSEYEDLFKDSERNFERIVTPYPSEFVWFLGKIYNGLFVSVDPELYYSIIRQYKPSLIIEIGSGHSTYFAIDALNKNKTGRIISIDPIPRRNLPRNVTHIQAKVQDVNIDIFEELGKNDILFIDSSHTTEEALYHCDKILPSINAGVVIHHHDFTYPYRKYYKDDPIKFAEPEVLLKFYMENRRLFEVVTCASYVRYKNPNLMKKLIKSYRWNPGRIPGSLWTRKLPGLYSSY